MADTQLLAVLAIADLIVIAIVRLWHKLGQCCGCTVALDDPGCWRPSATAL
jgi:hypothetical protein